MVPNTMVTATIRSAIRSFARMRIRTDFWLFRDGRRQSLLPECSGNEIERMLCGCLITIHSARPGGGGGHHGQCTNQVSRP